MKTKMMLPAAALMIASIFSLPAFAVSTVPPLAASKLTVKIIPDADVDIVQTTARQDGDNLVIDGFMQRKKVHGRVIRKGHIDITIRDEQGKTIHATLARVSPEILPRIDGAKSSFMAQIPVQAPAAGQVRVEFHSGPHDS